MKGTTMAKGKAKAAPQAASDEKPLFSKTRPGSGYKQCPHCEWWVKGTRKETCPQCKEPIPKKGTGKKADTTSKDVSSSPDFLGTIKILATVKKFVEKHGGYTEARVIIDEVQDLMEQCGGEHGLAIAIEQCELWDNNGLIVDGDEEDEKILDEVIRK